MTDLITAVRAVLGVPPSGFEVFEYLIAGGMVFIVIFLVVKVLSSILPR